MCCTVLSLPDFVIGQHDNRLHREGVFVMGLGPWKCMRLVVSFGFVLDLSKK